MNTSLLSRVNWTNRTVLIAALSHISPGVLTLCNSYTACLLGWWMGMSDFNMPHTELPIAIFFLPKFILLWTFTTFLVHGSFLPSAFLTFLLFSFLFLSFASLSFRPYLLLCNCKQRQNIKYYILILSIYTYESSFRVSPRLGNKNFL